MSMKRRKWVTAFAYGVIGADGKYRVGLVIVRGHKSLDFSKNFEWIEAMVNQDLAWDDDATPIHSFQNFSGCEMPV